MTELAFQIPAALVWGGIAVATMLVWFVIQLRRTGLATNRITAFVALRVVFLGALVVLVARPVWTSADQEDQIRNEVVLLIDRSQSMSLHEGDQTRYHQAVTFIRDTVLPAVDQSRLEVRPILFSDDAREVSGAEIAAATPDGAATNLGRAIVESVLDSEPPPLVTILLSDGITTNANDDSRAVTALVTRSVPVLAIGFGSQAGGRVISLDEVDAPAIAEPGQRFRVTARMRATGDSIPALDLLLLQDGHLVDRRKINKFDGPRTWTENFEVSVDAEGTHSYTVRVMPPTDSESDQAVIVSASEASAIVRVSASKEIRVLYVQGGLTWDYKFAHIALRDDPNIRLSGLSRTASTSKFFENVQSDVDLVNGFPNTLEQLGDFRVVVLSNLRPGDLTPHQQQLLARFCGEMGGGVLMIGGPQTFNASWHDSRLEELLPVRFAVLPDRVGNQRFKIQPTALAMNHPVFQISDDSTAEAAWQNLPTFTARAVVKNVKPAAEIWLESRDGSVLMASQRYGNGLASVICMQNLWRWRLARDSNPLHFDRFWSQLLDYLAESGREVFTIVPTHSQPAPGDQVELLIDHRASAGEQSQPNPRVRLRVRGPQQQEVLDLPIEINTGRQTTASFAADSSGLFSATLLGPGEQVLANREINVRDMAAELQSTSRNMETLRQFAGISGGAAFEFESSDNVTQQLNQLLQPDDAPKIDIAYAQPVGINGWILAVLLTCISAEWLCRKRWGML